MNTKPFYNNSHEYPFSQNKLGDDLENIIHLYHENGFALIENFLTTNEIADLGQAVERTVEIRKKSGKSFLYAPEQDPFLLDPVFNNLLRHPRLIPLIQRTLNSNDIYAMQSLLYIKAPGAQGRDPHQENFYHQAEPGSTITAWFAIDGCSAHNGGIYVYPGSHREPILPIREHKHRLNLESTDSGLKKDRGLPCFIPRGYKREYVNIPAGTLVLLHNQIIHGSGPNKTSTQFRKAHTTAYVKKGAHFRKGDFANRRLIPIA